MGTETILPKTQQTLVFKDEELSKWSVMSAQVLIVGLDLSLESWIVLESSSTRREFLVFESVCVF